MTNKLKNIILNEKNIFISKSKIIMIIYYNDDLQKIIELKSVIELSGKRKHIKLYKQMII